MTTHGPLVGITSRRISGSATDLPSAFHHLKFEMVEDNIARHVAAWGGVPVLLSRQADSAALVAKLDGLIMSGGEDVHPSFYDAEAAPETLSTDPERDAFELSLLNQAWQRAIPVLGICRGHQLINVALGGTLIQHLYRDRGFRHDLFERPVAERSHPVSIEPRSVLASLLGTQAMVNSFHHQAVRDPGDGVQVVARASDGVIEAYEVPQRSVLSVQWHPEFFVEADPVIGWLIDRAAGS